MSDPITIEAVFENGVFRPMEPLFLRSPQPVTLTLQLGTKRKATVWPDDVAQIYRELAEDDQKIAAAF